MLPSVALRKVTREMVGDSDYLTGLQKNLKVDYTSQGRDELPLRGCCDSGFGEP